MAWASSQHGRLRAVGLFILLFRALKGCVLSEPEGSCMAYLQKSCNATFTFHLLIEALTNPLRFKRKGRNPPLYGRMSKNLHRILKLPSCKTVIVPCPQIIHILPIQVLPSLKFILLTKALGLGSGYRVS